MGRPDGWLSRYRRRTSFDVYALTVIGLACAAVVAGVGVLLTAWSLATGERAEVRCTDAGPSSTCTVRRGRSLGPMRTVGSFPRGPVRVDGDCTAGGRGTRRCAWGIWVAGWQGETAARAEPAEAAAFETWVPFSRRLADDTGPFVGLGVAVRDAAAAGRPVAASASGADPDWFTYPRQAAVVVTGTSAVGAALVARRRRAFPRGDLTGTVGDEGVRG